jgi:deoxyribonuclease IV
MESHDLCIGSHIATSTRRGTLGELFKHVHKSFGARAIQIFIGNPYRSFNIKSTKSKLMTDDAKEVVQEYDIKLFIHSSYILNFAKDPSTEDAYWIDSLVNELQVADVIGAQGCVLHMGKSTKHDVVQSQTWFISNLKIVIQRAKDANIKAKVYVETSAGQGTELFPTIGSLDALADFYNHFNDEDRQHIQLCVDTCHIFAAGYNLNTAEDAEMFWQEWYHKIGVQHLGVIHINNSAKPYKSRVDRHAPLANGHISTAGLRSFVEIAAMHQIPMIIETPLAQYDIPVLAEWILGKSILSNEMSWNEWMAYAKISHAFDE